MAAGWLHSQLKSFQTVLGVLQENKQQSMHDEESVKYWNIQTLSIHVHIISPAQRDLCCQQVSLCHNCFGITVHCTSAPHRLQNVDHSLPLSAIPGMANKIISHIFNALVRRPLGVMRRVDDP